MRYEVGVAIATGWIVWINGPFPAGEWNDLTIARSSLHEYLHNNEYYIADGGYRDGGQFSITPSGVHDYGERQRQVVHAKHETINRKLKQWAILNNKYRHDLQRHGKVFHAVANIVQLGLETDRPVFQIEYDEDDD